MSSTEKNMFRDLDEKFRIQLEIEGYVVYDEETTPPRYPMLKAMLKAMASRRWPGSEWAIFIVRKRSQNTRRHIGRKRIRQAA